MEESKKRNVSSKGRGNILEERTSPSRNKGSSEDGGKKNDPDRIRLLKLAQRGKPGKRREVPLYHGCKHRERTKSRLLL